MRAPWTQPQQPRWQIQRTQVGRDVITKNNNGIFVVVDLIYLAESYSTYIYNNKNIVRTDIYIYNNKYHMYILSKKPRIT